MKIKIPPYPNYKLSDTLVSSLDTDYGVVENADGSKMSTQMFIFIQFESGRVKMIHCRPVEHNGIKYATAFPNPVHLFLSQGIEHFNMSEQKKAVDFPNCGQDRGDGLSFLDIEEDGTHDCFNKYIQYRVSSIIMLVSSLEAFLNHVIPNDFVYNTIRKEKPVQFNKEDIESPRISFREKLLQVIPQVLKNENFWNTLEGQQDKILALYEHRKQVIHLKTNSDPGFKMYINAIDKMLDFDIKSSIDSTIEFMNLVQPNFIELEK